jgi:formylglycine-generating enzyme required for sulfatase activity
MLISMLIISQVSAVTIQWVEVGDPCNMPDDTRLGGVDYVYWISTFEITNEQYCEFLNAVAVNDKYELYNKEMGDVNFFGGIVRSGDPGNYAYMAVPGREKYPVNFVSWFNTLRFTNWIGNGQPRGEEGPKTTEDGAYTFAGPDKVGARNPSAVIFLPNENEWYKAAYYAGGSVNAGYWDYATQSNDRPNMEPPPGGINSANAGKCPAGGLTNVGAYSESFSTYGTFDQNGNVAEWIEKMEGQNQWGLRGGSFDVNPRSMQAKHPDRNSTDCSESWNFGFRIASMPHK